MESVSAHGSRIWLGVLVLWAVWWEDNGYECRLDVFFSRRETRVMPAEYPIEMDLLGLKNPVRDLIKTEQQQQGEAEL